MKHPASRANWWSLFAILVLALILHFWGLSRFNGLIFDEVYFPKYAQAYLDGKPFFDGHPPLGKYLIAFGLWLSKITGPLGADTNALTGAVYAPWAYRWMEALAGSALPLVMAGIAWQLSGRWRVALLAALLACLDGLLLVESRYGLINIFLLLFGLLGHYFYFRALNAAQNRTGLFYLILAGVFLGACVSVKWNGLSFFIVPWALWMFGHLQCWWHSRRPSRTAVVRSHADVSLSVEQNPLDRAVRIDLRTMLMTLLAIPLLIYVLQWQPHLRINKVGFFEVHRQLLQFHEGVKDGPSEHPYCSRWYTWPVIARPMSYLFTTRSPTDPTPYGPPLEKETSSTTTYAVHALGNPLLWWLVIPAMIAIFWVAIRGLFGTSVGWSLRQQMRRGRLRVRTNHVTRKLYPLGSSAWAAIYMSIAYVAGILPWIDISRCTFIYHYLPSVVFGFLACAFGLERMLSHPDRGWRLTGILLLVLIAVSFIFWLPLFLGLPISREAFYSRMWFNSWI